MTAGARPSRLQALLLAIALLTAVATLGTSMIGLYVAVGNSQDIETVHHLMNSRLDELLEETRKNARAAGIIEGEKR